MARARSPPADLLVTFPAEQMSAWRLGDDAKSGWIEPHAGMAGPISVT